MRDIDGIIVQLRYRLPDVIIEQLSVTHPGADDDGIWFVRLPGSPVELQLESSTGSCPFLIESNQSAERVTAQSVSSVLQAVLLGLGAPATVV